MDVEQIKLGTDFTAVLHEQIARCDVFLPVIGSRWLSEDSDGERRINHPDDFVRIEVAGALSRDVLVIPILIDGMRMPGSDLLPDELKKLAACNALDLRHASYEWDIKRLVAEIETVRPKPDPALIAKQKSERLAIENQIREMSVQPLRLSEFPAYAFARLGYAFREHLMVLAGLSFFVGIFISIFISSSISPSGHPNLPFVRHFDLDWNRTRTLTIGSVLVFSFLAGIRRYPSWLAAIVVGFVAGYLGMSFAVLLASARPPQIPEWVIAPFAVCSLALTASLLTFFVLLIRDDRKTLFRFKRDRWAREQRRRY